MTAHRRSHAPESDQTSPVTGTRSSRIERVQAPGAPRWRRPGWRDPRLAGGIVLIATAVALGGWAVDSASGTEQVYAVASDVAPGADLTADGALTLVDSHPGTGAYIKAGDLPDHAVATRSLGAGELLPRSAVGKASDVGLRKIVLDASSGLPAGTGAGDSVDLWRLPKAQSVALATPSTDTAEVIAQGLTVSSVGKSDAGLVGSSTTKVEVLVPQESVADVLTAVGSGASLVLVPTGQGD